MLKQKSQPITKCQVWEAYKNVKANRRSAGVDRVSLKDYELKLKDNLYKLWNRMVSESYFSPPVLEVKIPKKDGRIRKLGIPTVRDRIAQMVARDALEPQVNPLFTGIPTDTGQGEAPTMRLRRPGSTAGKATG